MILLNHYKYKIDTKYMNLENSKTSKPNFLILNITDKIDLSGGEKVLFYQILAFAIHGKTQKTHAKIINLKC